MTRPGPACAAVSRAVSRRMYQPFHTISATNAATLITVLSPTITLIGSR